VLFVPLLVEAGFGCSLSVASNVFVITNQTFTCRNKNNAPLWIGNLRYQDAWFLPDIRLCRLLTLLLLLWRLLCQHRHELPQLSPSHLGSDRQGALLLTSYRGQTFNRLSSPIALLALLLTSPCRQTFNRPSTAIASVAKIYTNKLN
jgi:hypothetical protein